MIKVVASSLQNDGGTRGRELKANISSYAIWNDYKH